MKGIEPIRTDLFRFVTIRTPQLISQNKKELGFIYHPAPDKSFFLKETQDATSLQKARNIVMKLTEGFPGVRNYQVIRAINTSLYDFSSWLTKNRNMIDPDKLQSNVQPLALLPQSDLILLWDNLFYQTLARDAPHVRQASIQMIVANNFLQTIKKEKLSELAAALIDTPRLPLPPDVEKRKQLLIKRLANAKVVIPKVFSTTRERENPDAIVKPQYTSGVFTSLGTVHDNAVIGRQVANLQAVKTELKELKGRLVEEKLFGIAHRDIPVSELKKKTEIRVSPMTNAFIKNLPDTGTVDRVIRRLGEGITKIQRASYNPKRKGRETLISKGKIISQKYE